MPTHDAARAAELCFETRGLAKVYGTGPSAVHALRGVDLELPERELIVLLGASGSGKSTLLNILGGLDHATSGQLFFRGAELTAATQRELTQYRRRHVGFVFQFYNLMASLTARENVALVTEIAERPMEPEEALDLVGLSPRLEHFPAQLSGGEQQRVALARALVADPAILLADEPTGNLDETTGKQIIDLLFAKHDERGMTLVLVTHDHGLAERCDRVVRLRSGRVDTETAGKTRAGVALVPPI
jgi:putative ABC transport system ATP-binding protein